MSQIITLLHLDYSLATRADAELIRVTKDNGDVLILIVPEEGIGELDLSSDDIFISADPPTKK